LPFALIYFSALTASVTLHLRTVLLLFCCTVSTALLFSYSVIFIAASVRNKLIGIVTIHRSPLRDAARELAAALDEVSAGALPIFGSRPARQASSYHHYEQLQQQQQHP